ncbi:DUF4426 domain-containing protein, partial [Halochromatium glycolicum]
FYDQARPRQPLNRLLSGSSCGAEHRWATQRIVATVLMVLCVLIAALRPVQGADLQIAEQTWQLGDYVAHANAVRTDFLAQEVADKFEIERSNEKALVTVSVQKADGSTPTDPVEAEVRVTVTRSEEETAENVEMRTHRADEDVYHLGVLSVRNGEPITFNFAITPEPGDKTYRFGFERYFFTD